MKQTVQTIAFILLVCLTGQAAFGDDVWICSPCPQGRIQKRIRPAQIESYYPGQEDPVEYLDALDTIDLDTNQTHNYTAPDGFSLWWSDSGLPDVGSSHQLRGTNKLGDRGVTLYVYDGRAYDDERHDGKGVAQPDPGMEGIQNGYGVASGTYYRVVIPNAAQAFWRSVFSWSYKGYGGDSFEMKFSHNPPLPDQSWSACKIREYVVKLGSGTDEIPFTAEERRESHLKANGDQPLVYETRSPGGTGWFWQSADSHSLTPETIQSIKDWFVVQGKTRGKASFVQRMVVSSNGFNTDPSSDGYVPPWVPDPLIYWPNQNWTSQHTIVYYYVKLRTIPSYEYNAYDPANNKIAHSVPTKDGVKRNPVITFGADGYPTNVPLPPVP